MGRSRFAKSSPTRPLILLLLLCGMCCRAAECRHEDTWLQYRQICSSAIPFDCWNYTLRKSCRICDYVPPDDARRRVLEAWMDVLDGGWFDDSGGFRRLSHWLTSYSHLLYQRQQYMQMIPCSGCHPIWALPTMALQAVQADIIRSLIER